MSIFPVTHTSIYVSLFIYSKHRILGTYIIDIRSNTEMINSNTIYIMNSYGHKKSPFLSKERFSLISYSGGGTVDYFEHISKSFDQIDQEKLRKIVNYYIHNISHQHTKKVSLTKVQKAYYWIYRNSTILH